jgi:adenylosuccinate synthase
MPAHAPPCTAALYFCRYVQYVEDAMGVHIKWIGVGPGRRAMVIKPAKVPVAAAR